MGKVLKPVNATKNPGLAKLPTPVRNKMGFQKDGGKSVKKAQFGGLFGRKQEKVGSREARRELRQTQRMGRVKAKSRGCGPMGGAKYEKGGTLKKARNGSTLTPSKTSTSNRLASYGRPLGKNLSGKVKKAMGGVKMGKCRGGCY